MNLRETQRPLKTVRRGMADGKPDLKQLSRVQPLTVTQITLIERDLRTHTRARARTGIYVSNFIARAINHREMRLCARFFRVHVFLCACVLTLLDISDQLTGYCLSLNEHSKLLWIHWIQILMKSELKIGSIYIRKISYKITTIEGNFGISMKILYIYTSTHK